MRSRLVLCAVVWLLVFPAIAPAEDADPCLSAWQGQRLDDNLYNIDLMVAFLAHLKGCEDLKLKRLMEVNLQWAAENAREAIEHGGRLASPEAAANFLKSVREAILYNSRHLIDAPPPPAGKKPEEADLGRNLDVVEAWLQTASGGAQ